MDGEYMGDVVLVYLPPVLRVADVADEDTGQNLKNDNIILSTRLPRCSNWWAGPAQPRSSITYLVSAAFHFAIYSHMLRDQKKRASVCERRTGSHDLSSLLLYTAHGMMEIARPILALVIYKACVDGDRTTSQRRCCMEWWGSPDQAAILVYTGHG